MKKVLLGIALVFISTINVLVAQDVVAPTQTDEPTATKEIQDVATPTPSDGPTAMKDIQFAFCNDGLDKTSSTLNSAIKQGTPFKVCAVWINNGSTDAKINVDIADVGFTSQGSKSCELTNDFEEFINADDLEALKSFTIPAGNHVVKEFEIVFPLGVEGKQSGCFAYNLVKEGDGSMVGVVIRSATWMDFFVGNLENINNEFKAKNILLSINGNNDLVMNFDLVNVGNLESDVIATGEISNMFGFSKKISIDAGNITPGMTVPVEVNLGSIPSYGGLFNIKLNATATPYFSYDISNSDIDPTLLEPKEFIIKATYFQMPWLVFGVTILTVLLLILAFRKPKQKVIYVEKK